MFALLRCSIAGLAVLCALTACSPEGSGGSRESFANTDITGANYANGFRLTDHHGQVRTLADYKGKVVTLFFGYTQCPDVCPTNLLNMAQVMRELGPDADKVQVLFVTIDPERDTQELLAQYVPAFDPRFVGLYGDVATTQAVARDFKVFYQKQGDVQGGRYTVDHSTGTYVYDPQGRLRLYIKHGEKLAPIVTDLRRLLAGK
ncbi:MAG: SCO family protein [Rhodocyclaceae bacterium]|nr:MAG: SCO family protein [Rhodocyclaceae bacterium]